VKNNNVCMDLYLIDIDASIKNGNPYRAMIEEGFMIADNDPAILLKSLAIKIQYFKLSSYNDIRVKDVLNDIECLGKEAEEKMHEKFRDNKDSCMFFENREYFEECYERFIHLCEKKRVKSDILVRSR
jgi:hypothetical protein